MPYDEGMDTGPAGEEKDTGGGEGMTEEGGAPAPEEGAEPTEEGEEATETPLEEAPAGADEAAEEPGEAPEAPPEGGEGERELTDYEGRAIADILRIIEEQEQLSQERYRGLFGRLNRWFYSEGQRRRAETLEEIGEWQKNPSFRKWIAMGAKIAGGFGIAAAMTFTGGVGAILTPVLWSAGVREGYDGVLRIGEQIGWGGKRGKAELEVQEALSQKISALKELVTGGEATEETYGEALNQMLDAQNAVSERQALNMKGEHKGALIRAVGSTVLTIGTGLFVGVPLGTHDYDKATSYQYAKEIGGRTDTIEYSLDPKHRVFWSIKGGSFLYSPGELQSGTIQSLQRLGDLNGVFSDVFGRAAHTLGHGLPVKEKIGLAASGIYLFGRVIMQGLTKKRADRVAEERLGGGGEGAEEGEAPAEEGEEITPSPPEEGAPTEVAEAPTEGEEAEGEPTTPTEEGEEAPEEGAGGVGGAEPEKKKKPPEE